MPMMGRPPGPPILMLEQIREFFELKSIAKDAKEIPADIGVLMVVQPEGLSADTAYAIDQFALSGGKVLAFVDPVAETQRQGNPMMMMMQGPPDFSEFGKLLKAWGVAFDTKNVVGDISRARRVQFGGGPRASVTEYVLWLGLDRRNLDERDVLAGGIERLNLASVGFLEKAPDATTQFAPIIRTTADAMQIPAESVSMMPDAVGLLRNYKRGGTPFVLAARVSGDAKSAFPDGPPPAAPEAKPEDDKTKPPSAKAPAAVREETDAAAPPEPSRLPPARSTSSSWPTPTSCSDQFWVEVREFLGQQVAIPTPTTAPLCWARWRTSPGPTRSSRCAAVASAIGRSSWSPNCAAMPRSASATRSRC